MMCIRVFAIPPRLTFDGNYIILGLIVLPAFTFDNEYVITSLVNTFTKSHWTIEWW